MSALPFIATTAGGFTVGLIVGAWTLTPKVGPWRGQQPAPPPRSETVLVQPVQPAPAWTVVDPATGRTVVTALPPVPAQIISNLQVLPHSLERGENLIGPNKHGQITPQED